MRPAGLRQRSPGVKKLLRNAAVRCAHEIAWMDEEIPLIDSYARAVLQEAPREELAELLGRLDDAEIGRDLDTVVERPHLPERGRPRLQPYQLDQLLVSLGERAGCGGGRRRESHRS